MTNTQLRESFFAALKATPCQKQLVAKSPLAPQIVTLRDESGQIVGFSTAEQVSPTEVARLVQQEKQEVSKSAHKTDGNELFDDLFPFFQSSGVQIIRKSAEPTDPDDVLEAAFPLCFQSR